MRPLVAVAFLVGAASAQPPSIQNAQMQTRSAASGLESTFNAIVSSQTAPAWIGYSVPIVKGDRQMCCTNNGVIYGCSLEPRSGDQRIVIASNQPVKLEGPSALVVLYRVEARSVDKIRSFTPECQLDAGGLPFIWLNDVKPVESIRMLAGLAKQTGDERQVRRKVDSAVSAIAMHAEPAADDVLEQLSAAASNPESVRRQAAFWLGSARGRRGFEILSRIVREDPSDKVREHAVFALSESKEPEALNLVIRVAKEDRSPRVRGQALFWLAQRAGRKTAEGAINDAITNDPETEVKKKAVFALTQMPSGDGVPLLIQVARTNRNPEVRKQAMFWLGQSKDQRALAFIEEVLTGRRP